MTRTNEVTQSGNYKWFLVTRTTRSLMIAMLPFDKRKWKEIIVFSS